MTTIVFRDGVLAADTRAYSGSPSPIGFKQKIHAGPDGSLYGVSTAQPGLSEQISAWLMADPDQKADTQPHVGEKGFQALEITPEGEVYYYCDSFSPSGPLMGNWFAIGSGEDYAIGALLMGATAEEAVEVAMQCDAWTGGDVVRLRLSEITQDEKEAA